MPRYPAGQPIRLSTTTRDIAGTLVNPGGISLVLLRPDATQATFAAPTNDGTGLYHQDLAVTDLAQLGHYEYEWVTTGTAAGVTPGPRSFDVYAPLGVNLIDLDDLKDVLQITVTDFDADLLGTIDAATALVEDIVGPVLDRSTSEVVHLRADDAAVLLREAPVRSVTSLVSVRDGTSYDVSALYVDNPAAGVLRRKDGRPLLAWGPHTATYVVGRGTAVPPAVGRAGRVIAAHLWETERSPALRPSEVGAENSAPFLGAFAVPNRAKEMLAPYALPPAAG